jgi:radical SAM protein with 4Fe4S-binding SPASM domain
LRLAGKLLIPSYRFKWPQLDWWKNEDFTRYLNRFGELQVLNTDRKWLVYQLLRLVAHVPGDTAECGVFRGATSYLICGANRQSRAGVKIHHLFDSFEGLSSPGPSDGAHWAKGDLQCDMDAVQKALSAMDDGVLINGAPGTLIGGSAVAAGNVRMENPIRLYRESPLFRALRDVDSFHGRCGHCEFRHVCGGSRARAYAATGDAIAEDPLCVYEPHASA